MKFLRDHVWSSLSVLYLLVGGWFTAFDLTLKQPGFIGIAKAVAPVLLAWPLLPLYDIVSGNSELMIEGSAELLTIAAVFYAWYRLSRPSQATVKAQNNTQS